LEIRLLELFKYDTEKIEIPYIKSEVEDVEKASAKVGRFLYCHYPPSDIGSFDEVPVKCSQNWATG